MKGIHAKIKPKFFETDIFIHLYTIMAIVISILSSQCCFDFLQRPRCIKRYIVC